MHIDPLAVYYKSEQVTAREIEDEFVIVSITANRNGLGDELYFLNETGRELWENLNGEVNLSQLIEIISSQYSRDYYEQIRKDVLALIVDLLEHNIIMKRERRRR